MLQREKFYLVPRIYKGALGWLYVRWGNKLWLFV
jgi:hypothetical protein